jgi:hypothetical protein
MDIRKIVRRILSEQPEGENVPNPVQQLSNAQRELLARWSVRWKETLPELTDENVVKIFLQYRKALPLIKDESQPPVKSFIYRGNGMYTINDLRDGNKVNIKDLLWFLLEFSDFRIKIGDGGEKVNEEKVRLDNIFNERVQGKGVGAITPSKIEESKKMWDGNSNIVVDEGDLRVYPVTSREEAKRFGYYYQEKLKELVTHNVVNKVGRITDIYKPDSFPRERYDVSPWCVFSRGEDQKVMFVDPETGKTRMIINSVGNMYTSYRDSNFFYVIIDESKNLFGPGGEYYIGTIMSRNDGTFKVASMYNGEYYITRQELLRIYPKLEGHFDELTYRPFDREKELDDKTPPSILEIINEREGSPNAFWMQGPDEKRAYIDAGGQLKNPKSWETMANDLREQYINSIQIHDARQKIGSEEFMKAIMKSGISFKNKLDRRMKQIGTSGIGYLADEFMKTNYGPDYFGKKNPNIRIYKNKQTKKFGIYDVDNGDWVTKDGITYEPEFTRHPLSASRDIFDDENDKIYNVDEFTSPGAVFYTLKDMDEPGFNVYILSGRKYNELREKLDGEGAQTDLETDADIGEQQL